MASILIVDDEINIVKSFQSLLSPDHEVYSAHDGQEAIDKIKNNRIALLWKVNDILEDFADFSQIQEN